MSIFYEDKKPAASNQGNDAMAEGFFRLLVGGVVLIVTPFLLVSALLGYLLLCAWRDKKEIGVVTVFLMAVAVVFYFVGFPREVLVNAATGKAHFAEFWPGALFTDFSKSFVDFYGWLYSLFHWKINLRTQLNFMKLTRYVFWASVPAGLGFWAFLQSKKEWKAWPGLYQLCKAPLDGWLYFAGNPQVYLGSKLALLAAQCAFVRVYLLPHLPGGTWTPHATTFLIAIGAITGLVAAFLSERGAPKENPLQITVGDDGTLLTPEQINHHVHVLGESGFGKSVFLMRLISHHIRHGMGLIFIDLKADTDTLSHLTALCEEYGRTKELKLFDCSNPELSLPYNVLLRGNPTEIKDKLVGSFTWENSYYKNVAENFLLTVTRALVFLRDAHKMTFTLDDLYQATLSPEALVALQTELTLKNAPESLREDINHQAHFLRNRENSKELHGLRTQIKLLIDSEFGPLLTSTAAGIDLFEAIKSHQIVYVLLDSQRYGESAKKLGKLILQDLKSASGRIISEVKREERTPCTIIVDEFADLATKQFVGLLNRARGSGLGIVVAHQEMSDLEALSPTMRDQVMGNTATTVSFLQKIPESAERLAAMAGTKKTVKATRQLKEQGFLMGRQYTGQESEREVEEFIVHPNEFKNLKVGEAIIIGKYPKAWTKRVQVPRPASTSLNFEATEKILRDLAAPRFAADASRPLALRERVRAQYAKTVPPPASKPESSAAKTPSPSVDPNF